MAEKAIYTTPQGPPLASDVLIVGIQKYRRPWKLIVTVEDQLGRRTEFVYEDDAAKTRILAGNTTNYSLANLSEERRTFTMLINDGKIAAVASYQTVADPP